MCGASGAAGLAASCRGGDLTAITQQLCHEPDILTIQRSHDMPLIVAAQCGQLQTMQLLLDHRAAADCIDSRGDTALLMACGSGNVAAVGLLLKHGAFTASL